MKRVLPWWLMGAALLVPSPLHAQSDGLANLVSDLILKGITLPGADNPGRPHAGHFTLGNPTFGGSQGLSQPDVASIAAVEAFADRLRSQFANFPLGSSTGGFTFSFDAPSGVYTRNTESFGPAFTERAMTVGRRKLSLGFNYQHSSFDTFAGEDLRDGSISFYLPHTDCCSGAVPPPSPQIPGFESDVMQGDLVLQATTDTFAVFANYGVNDHLDVGVAVPFTRVDLEADIRAHILRLSSADSSRVHTGRTSPSTPSPVTDRRPASATSYSARNTTSCAPQTPVWQRLSISASQQATRTSCSASARRRPSSSRSCRLRTGSSPRTSTSGSRSRARDRVPRRCSTSRSASATSSTSPATSSSPAAEPGCRRRTARIPLLQVDRESIRIRTGRSSTSTDH